MARFKETRDVLVTRILEGEGKASRADRFGAFNNSGLTGPVSSLVAKVALSAYKITDEDVAEVRAAGFSEDQIFELVVCAAIGQATRQSNAALTALDAATRKE